MTPNSPPKSVAHLAPPVASRGQDLLTWNTLSMHGDIDIQWMKKDQDIFQSKWKTSFSTEFMWSKGPSSFSQASFAKYFLFSSKMLYAAYKKLPCIQNWS